MKTFRFVLALAMFIPIISCNAQASKKDANTEVSKADKVEVFYFHYTHRCVTCQSVEKVSKDAVTELYGNKVSFAAYNLEEDLGKQKGEELGVSGQTLLIVRGDIKINITNEGFMNARSNPDKLKQIIKEKIDPLL